MKRYRNYLGGGFALNLSKFPNVWVPFQGRISLEEALPIAAAQAMQLDNDALEVSIENPAIKNDVAILAAVSRFRMWGIVLTIGHFVRLYEDFVVNYV